jgi:hypothetical protein
MVKNSVRLPTLKKKKSKAQRAVASVKKTAVRRAISNPRNPTFGAVSTINTAPVAIGNSMRGFKSQTFPVANGIRMVGRDYGFTPAATGTVTGWACTGGMPLTPACMPTTVLRNMVQMYSKFKINMITFHYITSSSTATTGDVVFYSQKMASSHMINWTASSFLPFVLSEPENVIGPQWTNHSMTVRPKGGFKNCDAFLDDDQTDSSYGDIFLLSKTSSTESPGYVVIDYDVTFQELEYSPRASFLPTIKAQWTPFSFAFTAAFTIQDILVNATSGTSFIGGTTITAFAATVGDVYKIFVDSTNSTYTLPSVAGDFIEQLTVGGSNSLPTMADGNTYYATFDTSTVARFYPTFQTAMTNTLPLRARTTGTYNVVWRGYAKLIGSTNVSTLQYQV